MKLAVNELFYSIQGEGSFAGTPAVFIRLQGCDVGCTFCDTKHTWNKLESRMVAPGQILLDGKDSQSCWSDLSIDEIFLWVRENSAPGSLIVITGGEPLTQEAVGQLTSAMISNGYPVQIETSGTVWHSVYFNHRAHVTVSPKWEGKLPVLAECLEHADEVKVVVSSQGIIDKLMDLNIWGPSLYLQPETGKNFEWSATQCVKLCKSFGCKLSLQTHTFLNIR